MDVSPEAAAKNGILIPTRVGHGLTFFESACNAEAPAPRPQPSPPHRVIGREKSRASRIALEDRTKCLQKPRSSTPYMPAPPTNRVFSIGSFGTLSQAGSSLEYPAEIAPRQSASRFGKPRSRERRVAQRELCNSDNWARTEVEEKQLSELCLEPRLTTRFLLPAISHARLRDIPSGCGHRERAHHRSPLPIRPRLSFASPSMCRFWAFLRR